MVPETAKESQPGLLAQVQHYWRVLLKWKWTALLFCFVCVAAVTAYTLSLTPIYTAHGTVWIEDDPNILPFEDVQSFGTGSNLSSHTRLLRSRSLASDTIDKLKLYDNPDFAGKPKNDQPRPDPADPIYREVLVQSFIGNIDVYSKERTRLVDVSFSSRSPRLAADVLNALFDGYIEMIVSKRYAASEQATRFLNDQIAELRTEIEERERKLNEYGSARDILPLSTAEAPTVARIGDVSKALTEATLEKINRLNYYNQLKNAPLGEIPNAPEGSLIQRLREQYISLSRQYATRSATVASRRRARRWRGLSGLRRIARGSWAVGGRAALTASDAVPRTARARRFRRSRRWNHQGPGSPADRADNPVRPPRQSAARRRAVH